MLCAPLQEILEESLHFIPLASLPLVLSLLLVLCAVQHPRATGMEQRGAEEGAGRVCFTGQRSLPLCWFGVGLVLKGDAMAEAEDCRADSSATARDTNHK